MLVGFHQQYCLTCGRVRWHEALSGFGKCVLCEGVNSYDEKTNETVAG